MIGKLRVKSGFALKLPTFAKELEFKPGLNVLFGPNGCGKTTALNIAAAYSAVKQDGGWTTHPAPLDVKGTYDGKHNFPTCFKEMCVGKIEAEVEWDGTPTYYSSAKAETVVPHAFADEHDDMMNQLSVMFAKPSSGQLRLHNLGKLIKGLKRPDLMKYNENTNDVWKACYQAFCDYVMTLPRNGQVTLLIDEPDRSLSLPTQFQLWTKIIPQWATLMQVVVATHSPFCLVSPANLIECVDGYADECRTSLKEAFG
jgi:predicted ATPase